MIGLIRKLAASLQRSADRQDRAAAASGEASRLWHDIARALDECAAASDEKRRARSGDGFKGARR
ncbi:hypothetical protein [Devosia nitrariae]|uniref:Uncharacterized protein n=1 Tax=Devosia nitrariae TaxID=2071872 RepID=A0ABQ5WEI1_9HYPH|nr:hypothetical protein [Devosia nitrariae]GLQ58169.1 hypothetical protein GCM10010862_54280 [Devosia nitrariae]